VSAFYQMESKRTLDVYKTRIDYFLKNTTCKILIFTTEDCIPFLNVRSNLEYRILPRESFYSQHFATESEYTEMAKWYSNAVAEKSVSIDLLKLYAEKHMFVNRAIDMYPHYTYYIWNDIGSIIGDTAAGYLPSYPSLSKIQSLNIGDKICFAVRDNVQFNEYTTGIPNKRRHLDTPVAGTVILGNHIAWRRFIPMYHRSLAYLKENGHCWGNDEHVYFHMLCNNPRDTTGVITYGFKLPIDNIYEAHSWNMFTYLLTGRHADAIEMFEPIHAVDGYKNIKSAKWGYGNSVIDVTQIFHIKKDTSRVYVDCKLFMIDPIPGHVKYLNIEYKNGKSQRVYEYNYVTLYKDLHI